MKDLSTFQQRRITAAAWIAYCEQMKAAADLFLRDDFPITQLDLAEGLRYLAHLSFASIQRFMDGADPAKPVFYLLCDERIKSGGDNPDNRYYVTAVSADYEYEIRGNFAECAYYSIVALDRKEMTSGLSSEQRARRAASARLDSETLVPEPDGSVVVRLSSDQRHGNWLRIDERTNMVIVRCTLETSGARQVKLSVQRVDDKGPAPQISLDEVSAKLRAAAEHVVQTAHFFADWTGQFQQHLNQLPLGDQAYIRSTGGDPNILYYLSAWAIGPQQALVVRLPQIPPCRTWNFQLCNVWMESLDYTSARIHLNASTAKLDADNGVTIVVCASDPTHPNWLNTTGHSAGTMCMRFTGAEYPATAITSVLPLNEARELGGRLRDPES